MSICWTPFSPTNYMNVSLYVSLINAELQKKADNLLRTVTVDDQIDQVYGMYSWINKRHSLIKASFAMLYCNESWHNTLTDIHSKHTIYSVADYCYSLHLIQFSIYSVVVRYTQFGIYCTVQTTWLTIAWLTYSSALTTLLLLNPKQLNVSLSRVPWHFTNSMLFVCLI